MYAKFKGVELTGNYQVLEIDHAKPPKANVSKCELVRSDGIIVTDKRYGEKEIVVKGRILADNKKQLDERIDTLKLYLQDKEGDLEFPVADVTRKFKATCDGVSFTPLKTHADWTAHFICDSFGEDVVTTALSFTSPITTTPTSHANTFGGTYKVRPIIDFTINSCNPFWAAKSIDIANTVLSKKIRLTRTFNPFDRFIINAETKTVSAYLATKTVIDACDVTTGWTGSDITLSLETTNKKEGAGAIKGVMSAPSSMPIFNRLNGTVRDLSATAGHILFCLFIPTPTSGNVEKVSLFTGSDATMTTNFCGWVKETQADGSAIAVNSWNIFDFDLAITPDFSDGTPVRGSVKSLQILIGNLLDNPIQLNGVIIDYIIRVKANPTAVVVDYEGIFPDFNPGAGTFVISDDLDARSIAISGTYKKRYL